MARKKVTLARIVDDSARKASLKKRSSGLMKKVYELTILCGTNASVIIYNPDDKQLMTWPPRTEALKILTRFFSMAEMQQKKKMINQETYLDEKVSKMQEQLNKYERKHREIEIFNIMQYVDQGNDLDKLNVNDLKSLVQFSEEKLKEIRKRVEYCQQIPLFPGSKTDHMAGLSSSYQSFEAIKGGNDITLGLQPYRNVETGCNDNSDDMGLPSDLFRGNDIIASDIGLPYDVTKEWPTNFNP
ncbi:hypothetical protein LWI28_020337 [Acer negundo]|uniref:MADS-box domain-containing protein n=1 Tax=Acer negundo TaxID=4023 RepID=A0AAD5IFB9_ACENE|nr:hypothetical protein LWI28_020337 [Acer negundo]